MTEAEYSPYNPLDYENLTRNCIQELMRRGPYALPPTKPFDGAGVYALFYNGPSSLYAKIRSPESTWPIYVGKAVQPGGRKGGVPHSTKSSALFTRLTQHARSIEAVEDMHEPLVTEAHKAVNEASEILALADFACRYLAVTPLWITMAERFLLEAYRPVWNVCIEGFGNHDPGSGRHQGVITWWDALHPGRAWAARLRQTRSMTEAKRRLAAYMLTYELTPHTVSITTP